LCICINFCGSGSSISRESGSENRSRSRTSLNTDSVPSARITFSWKRQVQWIFSLIYFKIEVKLYTRIRIHHLSQCGSRSVNLSLNWEDLAGVVSFWHLLAHLMKECPVVGKVSVCNEIYQHLGQPHFLFCPTQYCTTRAVPTVRIYKTLPTRKYLSSMIMLHF